MVSTNKFDAGVPAARWPAQNNGIPKETTGALKIDPLRQVASGSLSATSPKNFPQGSGQSMYANIFNVTSYAGLEQFDPAAGLLCEANIFQFPTFEDPTQIDADSAANLPDVDQSEPDTGGPDPSKVLMAANEVATVAEEKGVSEEAAKLADAAEKAAEPRGTLDENVTKEIESLKGKAKPEQIDAILANQKRLKELNATLLNMAITQIRPLQATVKKLEADLKKHPDPVKQAKLVELKATLGALEGKKKDLTAERKTLEAEIDKQLRSIVGSEKLATDVFGAGKIHCGKAGKEDNQTTYNPRTTNAGGQGCMDALTIMLKKLGIMDKSEFIGGIVSAIPGRLAKCGFAKVSTPNTERLKDNIENLKHGDIVLFCGDDGKPHHIGVVVEKDGKKYVVHNNSGEIKGGADNSGIGKVLKQTGRYSGLVMQELGSYKNERIQVFRHGAKPAAKT